MKRIQLSLLTLAVLTLSHCGKNYEDLFKRGQEARLAGQWSKAKEALFEAVKLKETAEVYKELGNVYLLGEEKIPEAEQYYAKALTIDPNYINAQFNMGVIAIKKFEHSLNDKGKGDEALLKQANEWFEKVYRQNPNFNTGIEEYAKYHFYKKDFKKALEIVQRAIAFNSRNADAYSILGQIYFSGLKDYKQAFEQFDQARSLKSDDTDTIFFLWAASEKLKKTADANQYKARYEQMMHTKGHSTEQIKDHIRHLENQLKL